MPLVLVVVLAQFADGAMDAKSIALLGVSFRGHRRIATARRRGSRHRTHLGRPHSRRLRRWGPGSVSSWARVSLFASALITGGIGPLAPLSNDRCRMDRHGRGLIAKFPIVQRFTSNHPWREVFVVAGYALLAAVAYGFALNLWFWPFTIDLAPAIAFQPGAPAVENVAAWLRFSVVTSLGFDIPRALLAAGLIMIAGRGILIALRRRQPPSGVRSSGRLRAAWWPNAGLRRTHAIEQLAPVAIDNRPCHRRQQ